MLGSRIDPSERRRRKPMNGTIFLLPVRVELSRKQMEHTFGYDVAEPVIRYLRPIAVAMFRFEEIVGFIRSSVE
jgi:hypothetical protein